MDKNFKNIAIILASGSSERLNNLSTVKQFAKIAGKTVMEHTLEVFEKNENIDEIVIVTKEEYIEKCSELVKKNNFTKVSNIIKGGKTRRESSCRGLNSLSCDESDNILIHDAVRPFVSDKIINDCIIALEKYSAVDVAISSADTIIKVNEENLIDDIPKRKYLRRGQTPQAFKFGVIQKAHHLAENDKSVEVTDDCGLIKNFGLCDVYVVNGDDYNIKITYPIDVDIADKLFQIRTFNIPKTDLKQLKDKVVVIFGASRGIGESILNYAKKYDAKVYGFSRKNGGDITDFRQVERSLESVCEKEKKIDCVINTAGILKIGRLEDRSPEDISDEINVNYIGSINVVKSALKYLKETKGSILLFASSSYTRGRANYSVYSSAKSALVNLTQAIAEEYLDYGIKINIINPERVATSMRLENFGKEPADTLLKPETVAVASLYTLLSGYSGQVVNVRKDFEKSLIKLFGKY